jgi:hypothetical protein
LTIGALFMVAAGMYTTGARSKMNYVKLGVPLTLVVGVITIWLAPVFFPF